MRVTEADLTVLRACRRSKTAFSHEGVRYKSQYRRKGSVTTFWLVSEDERAEGVVVTRRVKRLLAAGLVERCLSIYRYGPDGDVVLTEAGRAAVDAAASNAKPTEEGS